MTPCPKCSSPLEGLATFCHTCQAYIADMIEGEAKVARVQLLGIREAEISKAQGLALLGIEPDGRPEEAISLAIRAVLELHGFDVYSLEQGYRKDRGGTRQTAGIADLYILGHGRALWIELKSAKGKLRPSQEEFRDVCEANGVEWALWRHETQAIEWAREARGAAA